MAAALLDAAEHIAERDGVAALSVRRVADEVGTTTRAVYSVFGSKDGLLTALAIHGFEVLGADVAALATTDDPLEDLVRAGAEVFRCFVIGHPALFRISFQRDTLPDGLVAKFDDARRAALSELVSRFERLAATGELSKHTPLEAALYFHLMCEGLATFELRNSTASNAGADMWRNAIRTLLLGLGQPPLAKQKRRR